MCGTSTLVPSAAPKTFLDLPREIRDEIYKEVLVAKHSIQVWFGTRQSGYHYMYDGPGDLRCTPCRSHRVFTANLVQEYGPAFFYLLGFRASKTLAISQRTCLSISSVSLGAYAAFEAL